MISIAFDLMVQIKNKIRQKMITFKLKINKYI